MPTLTQLIIGKPIHLHANHGYRKSNRHGASRQHTKPRQNGRHFPHDTFKSIFLNENVRISIKISLKFVPKGLINNIPALVQIMAWRRPGDKSLSEPVLIRLPAYTCVARPQWVNSLSHWQLFVSSCTNFPSCAPNWTEEMSTVVQVMDRHPVDDVDKSF